jgi:hypothetical protein
LRCSAFAGTVFEGGGEPCAVGSFAMQLALPIHSDLAPLEERFPHPHPNPNPYPNPNPNPNPSPSPNPHPRPNPNQERYQQRIASQPPPPITHARTGFLGRWRLLVSVDDEAPATRFPIELSEDGALGLGSGSGLCHSP